MQFKLSHSAFTISYQTGSSNGMQRTGWHSWYQAALLCIAHSPARLSSTQFHADSLTAHTLRTFIRGMFVAPAAQTSHPLLLGLNELHWSFLCPIGQLIYRANQNPAAAGASSFHLNLLYLHPHTVQQNFKGGIIYSTYLHNVSKLPHLLLSSIQDDWPPQMEILWEPQMTFEEA